jgi:hypothetical protein
MLFKGSNTKIILVLESLFFGVSTSLTTGLLFVYLVSIGAGVDGISVVVGVSAITKLAVHLLLYKYPTFLVTKVRFNFILQYGLDRLLLIFIPLTQDTITIAILYAAAAATPTTALMNLSMFGLLSEKDIKDITAKRTAALGVSSIVGYALAMLLLAFLPSETKFVYIFILGVVLGLLGLLVISQLDLSPLEGQEIPKRIEQPERLFSTSSYFIAVLAGGSLLSMVWVPYVMDHLKGPDYLAVAMNLIITLTSVIASLICKRWSFKTLRYSVGFDAATPILALATPIPILHPVLSAISSFTYTGSNFVGSFLFAGYKRWLGAIRSSILIVVIMCIANVLVSPMSRLVKGDFFLLFLIVFVVKLLAFILSSTTIPEVATVPEETARTYSYLLFNKSVTGYQISVELSKDTIMTTLKLIGFAFIFLTLYVIYRFLYLLIFTY